MQEAVQFNLKHIEWFPFGYESFKGENHLF